MNLRMLANFLKIAQIGSLKAAAAALNVAQPALSRQVVLLEEEFGAQLFVRHRRGVSLTEAGEQLRLHAERVMRELEQAHDSVAAIAHEPRGSVALGLPTSMRYVLSGAVVEAYVRAFPNVFMRVYEAIGHVVEERLRAGDLDVAILIEQARDMAGVMFTPLLAEDAYLVGPHDAGLKFDEPVGMGRLAEVPLILLAPHNLLRARIERALGQHGLQLGNFLEVEGQPLVFDLVRRGLGYTVLPFCAVQAEMAAGHISGAPVKGLTLNWTLAVNRLRAGAPAVRELVRLIHEVKDQRIASGEWGVTAGSP